jgi:DNA (cytosine-5)-methyltransferase 1
MEWETIVQVEWDKWCQKILTKNFPNVLRFGDIVEFNKMLQNEEIIKDSEQFRCDSSEWKEKSNMGRFGKSCTGDNDGLHIKERIEHIDILTGGFPCQPFSHAGKRKGTNDSRWLWPEMLTTIRILKPPFVVGENVAGLVSMENGKTLDGILSDLANEGYTTEQFIIPACGVGAWHRRDRIWILAYSINGTNRPIRGQTGETDCIPEFSRQAGLSGEFGRTGKNVSDSDNQGLQRREKNRNIRSIRKKRNEQSERYGESFGGCYWQFEPSVGRVANGIPNRVDRLKGLGNAIVPQVAYEIFKAIEQYDLGNNYNQ